VRGRQPVVNGESCPFIPVYADGRVYLHDETGVMAFRLGAISAEWIVGEMGGAGPKARQAARDPFTGMGAGPGGAARLGVRVPPTAWCSRP